MAENTKSDIYIVYLDRILAGEKDIGPVEDEEIEELLLLAKTMIAADFSVNSKTKDKLRKQLLAHLTKNKRSNLPELLSDEDELNEEDLNYVTAAGFLWSANEQKESCPYCGSKSKNLDGKCPLCGF